MRSVLIAGPTASGKSALAMDFADSMGGIVINADSMQVYDTLEILTARPPKADTQRVEHHLYGFVPVRQSYSVGQWYRDVRGLLNDPQILERPRVFVGGTGLYFKALCGGLADMPDIPDAVRSHWRRALEQQGAAHLHEELRLRDPAIAGELDVNDSQRIVRALEVFEASGRSIRSFQQARGHALIDEAGARKIVLMPDRLELRARIERRFEAMMEQGAAEEVRRLLELDLPTNLPAMKAIGVREIAAYLAGTISLDEAVERACIATRQYAKRQLTWFRNQLDASWERRP
ncbi:tRNA (adenosine(37)-N6)-dimethylallyltransferase MiaA [Hoeflea prorocentri]|uniref:tRNA dimethylallyltransferase n=1 Tax=Hoeflea prorocentri TaxID=1922333 RepID=A0A9X3UFX6_9HYPH|nr:tRNA (adenosine(37)-N6)-dimethylallyltransferase MiaA [Hoeflea prorocentri]MCY6379976.1 tRNA (adenosine(37)-N6)-dimethylallyltransferase MiaA [Hoeflea prorocentri]MDA5397776.1 tRNA (adenosine(37)-N6)-dimethylallyltransferase MiaA [Hoeflea prorocentri]